MTEPLVTRNDDVCGGIPCLRGTRIWASMLQDMLDSGKSFDYIREHWGSLQGWTDDDLRQAATFPRLQEGVDVGVWRNRVTMYQGGIGVQSEFSVDEIPDIVTAIKLAGDLIAEYEQACTEWERVNQ